MSVTRVLISGCCGFIGSNLAQRCVDNGWRVTGVDNMSNGHKEFLPKGLDSFFQIDFADAIVLDRIKWQDFDAVIHLAAVPRVSYSVEHPIETNDVNVTRTLKLLEACRGNIGRFVFASSSSVYGGASILPTPESHPLDPKSPYALQKLTIENYLKLYYSLYNLDSVSLRFFNVFGPNQLGDSPYATAVSAWLTAIKLGRSMRSDGDGTQTRDMCYVDNVVDACCKAAIHPIKLNADQFNVACDDQISNKEILKILKKRYPNAQHHIAPWRPGDVMHTRASIKKINDVLGYKPLYNFRLGLEKTIEWTEKNWGWVKDLTLRT